MNFERLAFLSLRREAISHHCVLLPSIYGAFNCKLLLEYFSFWQQRPVQAILANPDFFFYTSFVEDAIPIKVEHSRQIVANAQNTSFGEIKVFVVQNIEEASISAVNALLKIVEEPPKNTRFFFICKNIENVLPTIRSRSIFMKESITKKEDFTALCSFFEIEANYQLFQSLGYNFDSYPTTLEIFKNGNNFDLSKKIEASEAEKIWAFLELELQKKARLCANAFAFEGLANVLERMYFLRKATQELNTNSQSAFIELIAKLNETTF